ncbi:MAG: TolC family protein, partial [Cyanobacteria bacterium REEB65]|nr:TolC family protein [Cyanobacteria bacterium REEB65]
MHPVSLPPPPPPLTRQAAVSYGLAHNPDLADAAAQVAAAEGEVQAAHAWSNPSFSLASTGYNPTNNTQLFIGLSITQNFDAAGQLSLREKIAKKDLTIARQAKELAKLNLAYQIHQAYNRVLSARQEVVLAKDNTAWMQQLLGTATRRFRLGDGPGVDVIRAQVALAQANSDELASQNNLANAKAHLDSSIGRDVTWDFEPAEPFDPELIVLPPFSQLLAKALGQRPEVAQAQAALVREQTNYRLLQASKNLSGTSIQYGAGTWGGLPLEKPGDLTYGGVVGPQIALTATLPLWYQSQGELRQSQANQQGLADALRSQQNQIEAQVDDAFRQVATTEDQIR